MSTSPLPPVARQAQRVAVINSGAFALSFLVKYKDESGKEGSSVSSANLVNPQRATIDMADSAGIYPGSKMTPRISVLAGGEQDGPEVDFALNDLTAVYSTSGSIFSFSVELI